MRAATINVNETIVALDPKMNIVNYRLHFRF